MHPLLSPEVGRRELLLGNEAVVRGAIEAGVGLVTGYPGTPASEIGDTFAALQRERPISFEYSVNEKVALELAYGAALTGVRTLTSMKHLGLLYAGDPLSTMPYIGVVGGMVIVSAADPGCLTSPNEQDQRHLGRMLGIPTLDPATPDEARRMTRYAFELSEACQLPVLLRTTTRVCHTRTAVTFGPIEAVRTRGAFTKNPKRFVPTPVNARALREELERRIARACEHVTASSFNVVSHRESRGSKGIIATGTPRNLVRAVLDRLEVRVPLLEVGTLHPLPHDTIVSFLDGLDEVLIVEELTPYLEDSLLAIAHHFGERTRIHGKRDQMMPWPFELELPEVERRIAAFLGLADQAPNASTAPALPVPPRPPVLCAGCLHRNVFFAVTSVLGPHATYVNDIGCYTLGANEPHNAGDLLLAMGSSVPMASGIARTTGERVVAFLGDSTFFHSGLPGVINAVEQHDDVTLVVLDNRITAMTGFQPNVTSQGASQRGRIPDVLRALGVPAVDVVDASDIPALIRAFERTKQAKGVFAVVAEGPCAQWARRQDGEPKQAPQVHAASCHTCGMSEAGLGCGLPPLVSVQKRMAVQHLEHGPLKEAPRTSPCSLECPVGICIPAYVGAIAAGEPERALAAVTLRAALPSVCSHICHRPCEDSCVLAPEGKPIEVNALKRFVTERAPMPAEKRVERRAPPAGPKVAIVGAGPAGLAAARELVKRGYAPTLFEARARAGGMLEHAVPAYRLPREVLRRDVDDVLAVGVELQVGQRLGRDFSLDELRARGFAAVLLALGAQRSSRPRIEGMDLVGVVDALELLEAPKPCPGADVLVLGGGDVAIDVARTVLRQGARGVTLAFPESEHEMAAAPDTVAAALAEGAQLRASHVVTAISRASTGTLRATLARAENFSRDDGGVRFRVGAPADGIDATLVVCATGSRAELSNLGLADTAVNAHGWIAADDCGRTEEPWLFAAGDVTTGPRTVTAAMAAGVRAAFAIDGYLARGTRPVSPPAAPPPRPQRAHRQLEGRRPTAERTLTDAEARAEAERCLLCGMCRNCNTCVEILACPAITRDGSDDNRPRILESLCTACGACMTTCPNLAIGLPPSERT